MLGVGKLINFTVRPEYRNAGLAKKFLKHLVESANIKRLTARPSEGTIPLSSLVGLYESAGFVVVTQRKGEVDMEIKVHKNDQ